MGGCENHRLHIFFFPFLAHGHMIPTVDLAKSFAEKGVKATVITTPRNAPFVSKVIGTSKSNDNRIHIQTIEFPSTAAGLPEGCENIDSVPSPDLIHTFYMAATLLQDPLEQLLLKERPNCIVADMFFPWATDSAAKFGIPRLVFHGTCFFSLCAITCMRFYDPDNDVCYDSGSLVIPNLPGEIKIEGMSVAPYRRPGTAMFKLLAEATESELRSHGVVVNSFYELEKVYADYFSEVLGRKAWHIGPLSLCNRDMEEKTNRGKGASVDEHECLKWLDTKKHKSVVYVCFGSTVVLPDSRLREIATGLEASGQQFMWVVRKRKEDGVEWLPDGFEKGMEGKGLIIRGWAPQLLILEHEAIGAFVTHCGWNSILEAVSAGVPMITWPIFADQFFNEKLVTEVLKIGVPVGAKKWVGVEGDNITWDAVEKAVKRITTGEEATDMRNRAMELSKLARRAMEEGGSSHSDLITLIEELSSLTF
ncbi:unnamed protein product [Sphenostylis stenocarpa]|uniref:Glycosyltransferase n=1 Tax=Sphenostylis stenocarpa TaxID=92480 RepID=A0AA86STU9_9FABA|nr:unnamed protein product [Sphenostylis stenocarpa]